MALFVVNLLIQWTIIEVDNSSVPVLIIFYLVPFFLILQLVSGQ